MTSQTNSLVLGTVALLVLFSGCARQPSVDPNSIRISPTNQAQAQRVLEPLRRLQSATSVVSEYREYADQVIKAKQDMDGALRDFKSETVGDRTFYAAVNSSMGHFITARNSWQTVVENNMSHSEMVQLVTTDWIAAMEDIRKAEDCLPKPAP